uniref:Uncharacterized protein n=1 Tax=Daphnia galeata TaxID=27404 RepID=A0A8J2RL20_9CRUS|nr:unnamed protein product [Daphnia galeata]
MPVNVAKLRERIVWTACPGQLIEPGVIQHLRPAEGPSIAPRTNCTGANRRSSQHPSELNSKSFRCPTLLMAGPRLLSLLD